MQDSRLGSIKAQLRRYLIQTREREAVHGAIPWIFRGGQDSDLDSYSLISSWIWFSSGFCGAINISPNNAGSDLVAIVLLTVVSRKKEEGKIVEIFFFLFLIYSSLLEPRGKMKMCFRWISVVWYGRLSYFGNGWNAAWKPEQARSKTLWDFIG